MLTYVRRCSSLAGSVMSGIEKLGIDNLALRSLPVEAEIKSGSRTVSGVCFSRVRPTPVVKPVLVAHSQSALDLLDIHPDEASRPEFVEFFSGNRIIPGAEPAAHCYCGHQFGSFAGQLGDGATMYLCEVVNKARERWELQFKGAGPTPYSRHADGRKVLRSSIREFLCSEANHCLGIPTTRAGTCVTSDSKAVRDIFYDGHPIEEKCTIITRISPTFLRFGSFEIFKPRDQFTYRSGPSVGRVDILHQLLDYTTSTFFPEIHAANADNREKRTTEFFFEVCKRTAKLVALWQSVGFCHGVLNTDNMSIVGVTIDYGPFGFMNTYNPEYICNGSDNGGRYSYRNQPGVCEWNLKKLAEALSPCMPADNATSGLEIYKAEFNAIYLNKMRSKLGLVQVQLPEDKELIDSFLDTMHKTDCDFTNGFLCLHDIEILSNQDFVKESEKVAKLFAEQCSSADEIAALAKSSVSVQQLQMLLEQSPFLLAQLGMSVEMLKAEIEKVTSQEEKKKMTNEEKRANDIELWKTWIDLYRTRLSKEIQDDSSVEKVTAERIEVMNANNPRFILRNHIAQSAIEKAEKGDFAEVKKVLSMLQNPYKDKSTDDDLAYCSRPPQSSQSLIVN